MRFLLKLAAPSGDTAEAVYDTATSYFAVDALAVPPIEVVHALAPKVSAATPGRKRGPFRKLKVQMGLACNMGCSYCLQAPHAEDQKAGGDAEAFIANLDRWWDPAADEGLTIEFWGGEPFLHWGKLQALVAAFRRRHPAARLSVVTNGTLLDDRKVDWIILNDIAVAISHDGPGQKLRGRDPLLEDAPLAAIRRLVAERPDRVGFNAVLTLGNHSLKAIRGHIETAVGAPGLCIGTEGIVQVESPAMAMVSPLTEADHYRIGIDLLKDILSGEGGQNTTIARRINGFVQAIATRRPLGAVGQKCTMDREDTLAVDLKGDILLCQNAPEPDKQLGTVTDIAAARLTKATHFSFREACGTCPVVQLCQGGCMFLEGDAWEKSCRNSFTFHSAILAGAVHLMTGMMVTDIHAVGR